MQRAIGFLVALLVLSACVTDPGARLAEQPTPTPSPSTAAEEAATADPCRRYPPPFEVSYLPDGFSLRLRKGAGLFKGTNYPTEGLLGYYAGPNAGIHINFQVKGGPLPYEMNDTQPIFALGSGRIASIEGGFAVAFASKACDFRMDTYGISRRETIKVARDLLSRKPKSDRCPALLPFDPTYIPAGIRRLPFVGPGRRGHSDRPPEVVHFYRGRPARMFEIHRPGTLFTELAQADDAPTIEVLGSDIASFGPREPGGDDYIVQFQYPPHSQPDDWCSTFSLDERGLSLEELKKVAEGLVARPKEKPFRLLIHCGLSYPLRFKGRNWLPVDSNLRRSHNPPEGFGSDENYDMGTMRVVDDDTILYTSSEGIGVQYEPTDRPAEGCE